MNRTKAAAGVLMFFVGMLLLLFVWMINLGHSSAALDRSEVIVYILGSLVLIIGGIYAINTSNKKR
jgi:hypothetical protein